MHHHSHHHWTYLTRRRKSLVMNQVLSLQGTLYPYLPLIPPASNNRPRRIPRPRNLILIPLQINQAPTTHPHDQARQYASEQHTQRRSRAAAIRYGEGQTARGAGDQGQGEADVAGPGYGAEVAAEDGEEAEGLDAEEG